MSRSSFLLALLVLLAVAPSCSAVRPFSKTASIAGRVAQAAATPPPVSAPNTREDDCRLRYFTLAYTTYLAQAAVIGNWTQDAFDSLQLGGCSFVQQRDEWKLPAAGPLQWTDAETERLSAHGVLEKGRPSASCQWEVFVSPDGSDDNTGDVQSPLQTLHRALVRSRQVPRPAPYTYRASSPVACITLRGGIYYLGVNASSANTAFDSRVGAIHLTPEDSGLTIQSMEGETVTLSGGVPLNVDWKPWRNGSYYTSLDDSNIPAFDRAHFNELYVDNQRAVRAKYPNGDPSMHGLYDKQGWNDAAKAWLKPKPHKPATEIAISSPARVGHFRTYQLGVNGPASVFDPPSSFWATNGPPAGGTFEVPSGVVLDAETAVRSKQWSDVLDGPAYVFAFHSGHWGSWAFEVDGFNSTTSSVEFGMGGFQEARGSDSGAEWYISNILEELDSANEYYISYTNNTLFYQPNTTSGHPKPTSFVASQLPCILSIQGSPKNPVNDISIVGITFAHTASTFLRGYEVPSGGDWSVHRGGAVFLDNTANVIITQSTFTQLGGNGLVISNYNMAATVVFNEFVWLGESAIVILGSVSGIDGVTNTQQPISTFIVANLIHEIGAYIKQVAGVVTFLQRRPYIGKNAMFNLPRAGINVNDGFAGGMSIEGNVIFNTVRETSDHGPINSWDRQPYLVDYGMGATMVPERNLITANLLFNAYASHDDGSSYYTDSYNVLVYGGAKNYFGHDKTAHHQLYLYPDGQRYEALPTFAAKAAVAMARKYGGEMAPTPAAWGAACVQWFSLGVNDSNFEERYYNNTCIMQSTSAVLGFPFGGCDATTPSFQSAMPHLNNNTYLTPSAAPFVLTCNVNGTAADLNFTQWQALGFDAGSLQVVTSTSTLTPLLNMAAEMLGMAPSKPTVRMQ